MKQFFLLMVALVMAATLSGQQSMTLTYTDGDLPTDRMTNWNNLTACPGTMTAVVPEGQMVTNLDLSYSMTALNWGWMSDQRSKLISPNLDAGESSYVSGTGGGQGSLHYNRPGLSFANFATGEIVFELHAGRTFGSNWGCNMADQKVDNNSWQITIHYMAIPACMFPYNLNISEISNVSAGIAWGHMGVSDFWEIAYGGPGFDPETEGTLLTGITATSHTLTELEPYTDYEVYVRANCGADGLSDWSEALSFQTHANPLAGNYTINQNEPGQDNNFSSFAEFALVINTGGLAGPVVVDVAEGSGPYEEQVIFGAFANSNPQNTITINGNGEVLEFRASQSEQRATLKMEGTAYVNIHDLTIRALGTASPLEFDYGYGVQLMNNAQHLVFDNCHFIGNTNATNTHEYTAFLASNSHTSATTNGLAASNITIQNSIIEGGFYGMLINGPENEPFAENNQIINCEFVDFRNFGLHTNGQHDMIIHNNSFARPTRPHFTNVDMIYFSGQMGGAQITNNHIGQFFQSQSTSAAHGIRGNNFSVGSDKPMLIANNHITGFNNMNGLKHGIFLRNSSNQGYINLYHNTVLMHNPDYNNSQTVTCFYHNGGGAVLDVKNNVFSYTSNSTGWKSNMFFASSNISLTSDNNVLHQGSTYDVDRFAVNWTNAHNYNTLEEWQYARDQDLNSVDNDPLFTHPDIGNLLPTNGAISKIGADLSAIVSHDITGQLRSVPPDPGAYEFEPLPCPLVSQVMVSEVGLQHATVSWIPNGNESLWWISYGEPGFDPEEGTIVDDVDEMPYVLQGLEHANIYELYVRADCGDELTSIWAGPVLFSTLCDLLELPYVQNFDAAMRPDLPICWDKIENTSTTQAYIMTSLFNQPHSPPNHLRFNNSFDHNAELLAITPAFDEDMEGKTVYFYAKSDHPLAQLEVGTISDDDVFSEHEVVDIALEYSYYHLTFGEAAAGHHRIGFRHGVTATYQNIYLDDVTVAGPGYAGSISGTVSDPDGQTVTGARVFCTTFETFTDALGHYEAQHLMPGNYDITIEKGGFAIETATANVQTGEQTTHDMEFTYGSNEFPLNFTPRNTIMMPTGALYYNSTATNGTHLYMSTDDGRLHTFDLADPENPVLLNSLDVPGVDALFFDNYLFAGNGSAMLVYSLDNPEVPALIQTLELNGNLMDMHFDGSYAYALMHEWDHNARLVVFNLAAPGAVEEKASIDLGGGSSSYMQYIPERELLYIHGLSRWESYTMSIADVSDPVNPVLSYTSALPYTNSRMAAYPNHIILASNSNNNGYLLAFGTHDPTAPVLLKDQLIFENHFINEISALGGTLMTFVRNSAEITSLTTVVYDEDDNHFYRGVTLREGLFMPVTRFNFHQLGGGRFSNPTNIYWSQSTGVSFLKSSSYGDRYRDYEIEKDDYEVGCDPGSLIISIFPEEAAEDGCTTNPAAGVTHHYSCTPTTESLLAIPDGYWSFKQWHGAPPGNPSQKIIEGHESVVAEFAMAVLDVSDILSEREYCVSTIVDQNSITAGTVSFTASGDDWILNGFYLDPKGTGDDAADIDTVWVYKPLPEPLFYIQDDMPLYVSLTPPVQIAENETFTVVVIYNFGIDKETYANDTTKTFGFEVSPVNVVAEPANFPIGKIEGKAEMRLVSIGRVLNNYNMVFGTVEQAVKYTQEEGTIYLCPLPHATNAVIDKKLTIQGWEGMREETLVSPANPFLPVFHLKPGAAETRLKHFTITE